MRTIREDDPTILEEHLAEMDRVSPPESCHSLDVSSLKDSSASFWSACIDDQFTFAEPHYGITLGQAVVFYDDARVLGGGWIL